MPSIREKRRPDSFKSKSTGSIPSSSRYYLQDPFSDYSEIDLNKLAIIAQQSFLNNTLFNGNMTILDMENYDYLVNFALSVLEKNSKKAFYLLQQANSEGNQKAKFLLIKMKIFANGSIINNQKLANSLLMTLSDLNGWIIELSLNKLHYKDIYFTLGYIYEFGIVKMENKAQNMAQALKYYTAGALIEAKCTEKLASWYLNGRNVKKSIKTALKMYDHLIYNQNQHDFALFFSIQMDKESNKFDLNQTQRKNYAQLALKYTEIAISFRIKSALQYHQRLDEKVNGILTKRKGKRKFKLAISPLTKKDGRGKEESEEREKITNTL